MINPNETNRISSASPAPQLNKAKLEERNKALVGEMGADIAALSNQERFALYDKDPSGSFSYKGEKFKYVDPLKVLDKSQFPVADMILIPNPGENKAQKVLLVLERLNNLVRINSQSNLQNTYGIKPDLAKYISKRYNQSFYSPIGEDVSRAQIQKLHQAMS